MTNTHAAPTLTPPDQTTENPAPTSAGAAPAAGAPPVERPSTGVVVGPDGQQAVFMSESEYFTEEFKENHSLPIVVTGFGVLAAALIAAGSAMGEGGMAGAIGAVFGTVIGLVLGMLLNTGVGWVVGKLFSIDFGSIPSMLLRFAAFTAAYTAVFTIMTIALGPLFAMFFCLPVMIGLAIWLVGMDMFQSLVFAAVLSMANWMLASLLMMSIASMAF